MKQCIDCKEDFEESQLSHQGLCPGCGFSRQLEAQKQIREHKGPIYEKYKARHKAATTRV